MNRDFDIGDAVICNESRVCGTCAYGYQEPSEGVWVCNCEDSEEYGLYIAYNDYCEEWEGKE